MRETGRTIVIPLLSRSVGGKTFRRSGPNPGCGGTEYVAVALAMELAASRPDDRIVLACETPCEIRDKPENLVLEFLGDDIPRAIAPYLQASDFVVCAASKLVSLSRSGVDIPAARTVAWLHHPFVSDLALLRLDCAAYVSVGSYAFHSNSHVGPNHWHIYNILPGTDPALAKTRSRPAEGEPLRCVHLGALVPAKGFHLIAAQWREIRRRFPGAVLEVIGGTATYDPAAPRHDAIPTSEAYARTIQEFITDEDIANGSVVFHGNLGEEKLQIIARSHVALLNPTGKSETYASSIMECMACGVPVIASGDYGMSDSMHRFPELTIRSPAEIPDRLSRLMCDDRTYREISERALATADYFFSLTPDIVARWNALFDALADDGTRLPGRPPMQTFHGNRAKLHARRLKARLSLARKSLRERLKTLGG